MARAVLLLLVLLGALLAGCGRQPSRPAGDVTPSEWTLYRDGERGFEVGVPAGWRRASGSLTPNITEPREILALATVRLRGAPRDNYCRPWDEPWLPEFSERDALVTIQEGGRGSLTLNYDSYPPRPQRFRPEQSEQGSTLTQCFVSDLPVTDHWFGFNDSERAFHALVIVGRLAPERVRAEAWRILDSLRFDPDVKPDWPAST
jgi:hypothetical protein